MNSSGSSSCSSTSLDAISSPSFTATSSSDTDGPVRSPLDVPLILYLLAICM